MAKRRIFIRGLPKDTTEESLASRFEGFGCVDEVSIAKDGFDGKECRGFGHFSIDVEEGAWKKCLSALNGSKWKGNKIHISEAKPIYKALTRPAESCYFEKPLRGLVRHASDMSLVNDNDTKKRKGWRRSQFGRLIAVVKIRKPTGELIVMDPSHHKDALTRFYTGTRQKPLQKLTWFSDDPSIASSAPSFEDNLSLSESASEEEVEDQNNAAPNNTSCAPLPVIENSAVTVNAWEQISGGQTFSLAACLNLPKVEVEVRPLPSLSQVKRNDADAQEHSTFSLEDLFFDFNTFLTSDQRHMLIPKASKLESMIVWKSNRSEIRKDFKKQSKEAKRSIRKRSSHARINT